MRLLRCAGCVWAEREGISRVAAEEGEAGEASELHGPGWLRGGRVGGLRKVSVSAAIVLCKCRLLLLHHVVLLTWLPPA